MKVYVIYQCRNEVADGSTLTCGRQMSYPKRYKIGNLARFMRDISGCVKEDGPCHQSGGINSKQYRRRHRLGTPRRSIIVLALALELSTYTADHQVFREV